MCEKNIGAVLFHLLNRKCEVRKMKAVIIGVFGEVGFQLCRRLLEEGNEVIGYDLPSRDEQESTKREEQQLLIGRNANFNLVKENLLRAKNEEVDIDFDVLFYVLEDNPTTFYRSKTESNDRMTQVITLVEKQNAKLIYQSSYEVYGELIGDINEETKPKPRTPRGFMYDEDERQLMERKNVKYVILRTPTTYLQKGLNVDETVNALLLAERTNIDHEIINLPIEKQEKNKNFKINTKKAEKLLRIKE
jgi:nucleoside-diphosphate-sugar epimerase